MDLRRAPDGSLFANEPTLIDVTYVDDPRVAYRRGALVLRLIAREIGPDLFRRKLRELMATGSSGILGAKEILAATGGQELALYYAQTTRLPDLRLEGARIVCDDPAWPGGRVPVRIGARVVDVEVRGGAGALPATEGPVEVDPERLWLDPVRSNGVR
jgi:hypothetical protein